MSHLGDRTVPPHGPPPHVQSGAHSAESLRLHRSFTHLTTPETQRLQLHTPLLRACAAPRLPPPPSALTQEADNAAEETGSKENGSHRGKGTLHQEKGRTSSGWSGGQVTALSPDLTLLTQLQMCCFYVGEKVTLTEEQRREGSGRQMCTAPGHPRPSSLKAAPSRQQGREATRTPPSHPPTQDRARHSPKCQWHAWPYVEQPAGPRPHSRLAWGPQTGGGRGSEHPHLCSGVY